MRAVDLVVAEAAHLLVGDLGEPLHAEAERGRPEARRSFEVLLALVVIDVDPLRLLDDRRPGLQVIAQVGLRMHEARDIPRVQAVGANVHGRLLLASLRGRVRPGTSVFEIPVAKTPSPARTRGPELRGL